MSQARRITIPFVGGSAVARSVAVNNQKTVNLIQSVRGAGAKAPVILESAPGAVERDGSVGTGPCRTSRLVATDLRAAATEKELYGVFGTQLIAMTDTVGNVVIGTLNANSGRCPIALGRNYMMIVDGTDGYTYNGTTFAQIADADFPDAGAGGRPTHCFYIDGFFVVNDALSDNWYISDPENPTIWNALDFESASVAPDAALAGAAYESLVWILGEETAQAYYNNGNADFPYALVLNATQEVGILAPDSLAESDDGMFFLATTPEGGRFVYRIRGTAGEVISNEDVEHELAALTSPEEAYGFIYQQAGKSFYVLQLGASGDPFNTADSTLIYNITVGDWEHRALQDGSAWRAGGHGVLNNRNIIGSALQALAFELDLQSYEDAGQELVRLRRSQIYHLENRLMDWWAVVVDIETGVGLVSGQGEDPMLKLRYSDDGGKNWSSWLTESMGRIGETAVRVVFRNLGQSRNRVLEVACSDPVPLTIVSAYADVSVLAD